MVYGFREIVVLKMSLLHFTTRGWDNPATGSLEKLSLALRLGLVCEFEIPFRILPIAGVV